jgi:hypothetical protein
MEFNQHLAWLASGIARRGPSYSEVARNEIMNQPPGALVILYLSRFRNKGEMTAAAADHAISFSIFPAMNMSRPARISLLTMFGALACGVTAAFSNPPPVMARQIVIRAPKIEFVAAAMANPDDETLAKILWDWVAQGKAEVLSDIATGAAPNHRVNLRSGKM